MATTATTAITNTILIKGVVFRAIVAASISGAAALLFVHGQRHFLDGIAHDRALPVPIAMLAEHKLRRGEYLAAASDLEEADRMDGEASIARGEALVDSGAKPNAEAALFEGGIAKDPASVRGWTLFALSSAQRDPHRAAEALKVALIMAPADYWTAAMRAEAAALLWSELDSSGQESALAEVQALWDTQGLRPMLVPLLSSRAGAALVTRAFRYRRNELIALNRWVAARGRQAALR